MSTKYRNSRDVPLDTIITRLEELSDAVIGGRESQGREFTMRIPAECDRDADLVIGEAAVRLVALQAENEALRARVAEYEALTDELDATTRRCYLSGPTVVNQFKRLRQQADEQENNK